MARQMRKLSTGRPPLSQRVKSLSRKRARRVITGFHQLRRQSELAAQKSDKEQLKSISTKLDALGGIESYQEASLQGQKNERGGDTSRMLVNWMSSIVSDGAVKGRKPLRLLEIGALSTQNACARSGYFDIDRIDLNSQSPGILRQDFMQRPLAEDASQCFDVISLSLVLNFVATPKARGAMLQRTVSFLRPAEPASSEWHNGLAPGLFFVLPAPCVNNSRYLDTATLTTIMGSLGYDLSKETTTSKLYYSMWQWQPSQVSEPKSFSKRVIRSGRSRNNFAITLETEGN
jgi:25S rRNA (adenine2142-N1)-methyltransferase